MSDISSRPLDAGVTYSIDVAETPEGEEVRITVPPGQGLVFAHWMHRFLSETDEQAQARRAADLLAELSA